MKKLAFGFIWMMLLFVLLVSCTQGETSEEPLSTTITAVTTAKKEEALTPSEGLTFSLSKDQTAYTVTGIGNCYDTVLVIPSTYNGKPVTAIGSNAFKGSHDLSRVVLPESIKVVQTGAFSGCHQLNTITVAPDNPVFYSEGNCLIEKSTKTVVVGCMNSTIPNGVETIGKLAFKGLVLLKTITIPDSVKTIETMAFRDCTALSEVVLPSGLLTLGQQAFMGCSALTEVALPKSVQTIGSGAFEECRALERLTLPFCGVGTREEATMKTLFGVPVSITDDTVPESFTTLVITDTTVVSKDAFRDFKYLKSITLPSGVVSIGENAFKDCQSLVDFAIPEGVQTIGEFAFNNCWSLESVVIPSGVTEIGQSTFAGCSALTEVVFPDGMKTIGRRAFDHCSSIVSLTLPASLRSIGEMAFSMMRALESVTLPAGLETIDKTAFSNCSSLTAIVIPQSVTTVGALAFQGCTKLTVNCEIGVKPEGWHDRWYGNASVVWGYIG